MSILFWVTATSGLYLGIGFVCWFLYGVLLAKNDSEVILSTALIFAWPLALYWKLTNRKWDWL